MKRATELSNVRNIGIAAHVDAGKTTLTERILYYTGASHKIGEVHDGAAHMDYMAEEQSHGITITSAVTKAPWRDHLLQVVDTPGHVDFTIEVERSMRVLDGCILVLDGVRGVEPQTETVWRQRKRFGLPALFFVNKMDRPGADFEHALESIRERFDVTPVAITLPLPEEQAVVHLIDQTLLRFTGDKGQEVSSEPCPPDIWSKAEGMREALLLQAADLDESLTDRVLDGEDIAAEELWQVLRAGVLGGQIFPCFGGSALRNYGVQPLLDAAIELLPAPLDRPPSDAVHPDGTPERIEMSDKGTLVALAFKVQLFEGRRHVFARVYRSRMRPGDAVEFMGPQGKPVKENIARIFDVDAGRKSKLEEAGPGQIVLLAGLRKATTGDTLCAPGHVVSLESIELRQPVLGLAIEPAAGTEEDKLLEALGKVLQEDPTLRLDEDPETGQRVLRGMGELHLQIVSERLAREFNVEIRTGRPAVAVRETIATAAKGDVLYAPPILPEQKIPERKARAAVEIAPRERASGNEVVIEPRVLPEGATLSVEQTAALQAGVDQALAAGPLQGSAVEDVAVRLVEVELFGPASSPDALTAAAAKALQRAFQQADPLTMEPLMAVEVVIPEERLGTVLGDLQARLALIRDTHSEGENVTVHCRVALKQLLGYATDLRGMTQGRGQFSMLFECFDTV